MSNLVRIGSGKPRPIKRTGRWGEDEPGYYVNPPCYVDAERWLRIQLFQSPLVNEDALPLPGETFEECKFRVWQTMILGAYSAGKSCQTCGAPQARHVYTLWEQNGYADNDPDKKLPYTEYMRFVAMLGQSYQVRWTWYDYYIKYPVMKLTAFILSVFDRGAPTSNPGPK